MLLRLRGPDGMARVSCEPSTSFGELGKLVSASARARARACARILADVPPPAAAAAADYR